MPSMPSQIELFEEMSTLSAQMVEAATANDWERLVTLEKSVAALRDRLMANSSSNDILSVREIEIKRALIQRILDDDAEIRRHTEPWMEHVRKFLGSATKRKQVENAYSVA